MHLPESTSEKTLRTALTGVEVGKSDAGMSNLMIDSCAPGLLELPRTDSFASVPKF